MTDRDERLHADISGDPASAPPVVFLHGFGGSAEAWAGIAGEIGRHHPTIAYDLPGHHRSLDAEGRGGAGRMAKAILADLAARGIDRAHLVGHSMGGAVASLMALRAPDLPLSVTLLAPGGFGLEINIRLLERFAEARDEETLRLISETMFGWTTPVPDDHVRALAERRNMPGAVEALRAVVATMTTGEGSAQVQGMLPVADLAELAAPVRVVWGGNDCVLPTRQAHELPGRIALNLFEGAGHMLIEELPQAIIRIVAQNIAVGEAMRR